MQTTSNERAPRTPEQQAAIDMRMRKLREAKAEKQRTRAIILAATSSQPSAPPSSSVPMADVVHKPSQLVNDLNVQPPSSSMSALRELEQHAYEQGVADALASDSSPMPQADVVHPEEQYDAIPLADALDLQSQRQCWSQEKRVVASLPEPRVVGDTSTHTVRSYSHPVNDTSVLSSPTARAIGKGLGLLYDLVKVAVLPTLTFGTTYMIATFVAAALMAHDCRQHDHAHHHQHDVDDDDDDNAAVDDESTTTTSTTTSTEVDQQLPFLPSHPDNERSHRLRLVRIVTRRAEQASKK